MGSNWEHHFQEMSSMWEEFPPAGWNVHVVAGTGAAILDHVESGRVTSLMELGPLI